ncbi:MAG: hypothetical protein ACLSWI_04005, partial [Candidatus Gastranaerophilaceae bacterium]
MMTPLEKNVEIVKELKEKWKMKKKKEEKDTIQLSDSDFDEADVETKANNYVQNIIATVNLTEESKSLLKQYMATFEAAKFIKSYGPFASTAEISAAMYAVTSGLIKRQDDDQ